MLKLLENHDSIYNSIGHIFFFKFFIWASFLKILTKNFLIHFHSKNVYFYIHYSYGLKVTALDMFQKNLA